MKAKQIMLAVMCVLLAVTVIMACIFFSRVGVLLQALSGLNFPGGNSAPQGTTTLPPQTGTDTEPQPTPPPATRPTVPNTSVPTEPGHQHEYVLQETVEPSCDNMGYDILVCNGCGRQDIDHFTDPVGHNFSVGQTIPPTCTEQGYTTSTCSRCGVLWNRNFRDPLGHDRILAETVEATCQEPGYERYRCSRCDDETRSEIPATGHEYKFLKTVAPTCEEPGYDIHACVLCRAEKRENEVPALGHTDGIPILVKAPTCTGEGLEQTECTACGRIVEQIIPATGHSFGDWITDKTGTYHICVTCGFREMAQPMGHTFGPWTVDATGATRTCETCGQTETVPINQLKITRQQSTDDANGRLTEIWVGTNSAPDMIRYTIRDLRQGGSITPTFTADRGLVITYRSADGQKIELVCGFQSGETVIPAE